MHAEMARWIENVTEPDLAAELSRMKEAAETGDESAFTDAFFQDLSFGTGRPSRHARAAAGTA